MSRRWRGLPGPRLVRARDRRRLVGGRQHGRSGCHRAAGPRRHARPGAFPAADPGRVPEHDPRSARRRLGAVGGRLQQRFRLRLLRLLQGGAHHHRGGRRPVRPRVRAAGPLRHEQPGGAPARLVQGGAHHGGRPGQLRGQVHRAVRVAGLPSPPQRRGDGQPAQPVRGLAPHRRQLGLSQRHPGAGHGDVAVAVLPLPLGGGPDASQGRTAGALWPLRDRLAALVLPLGHHARRGALRRCRLRRARRSRAHRHPGPPASRRSAGQGRHPRFPHPVAAPGRAAGAGEGSEHHRLVARRASWRPC
jgi:hypothetical protein